MGVGAGDLGELGIGDCHEEQQTFQAMKNERIITKFITIWYFTLQTKQLNSGISQQGEQAKGRRW